MRLHSQSWRPSGLQRTSRIGNKLQYQTNADPHGCSDAHASGRYATRHQSSWTEPAKSHNRTVSPSPVTVPTETIVLARDAIIRAGPLLSTYSIGRISATTVVENVQPGFLCCLSINCLHPSRRSRRDSQPGAKP